MDAIKVLWQVLHEIQTVGNMIPGLWHREHDVHDRKGNGLQLLGRASLLKKDVNTFERAMAEAEELAATIDPGANSIHGHYNLGLVYEEYAKSYAAMGQVEKALEYVKRTEDVLPRTYNDGMMSFKPLLDFLTEPLMTPMNSS